MKTIVLLHGYLSSSKYWNKLEPYLLKAGYKVVKIDLLGFGDAPKPIECEYSYKDHVEYISYKIDELLEDEKIILVGHSMGSLIALRYAIKRPKKVFKLVMLNPPMYANSMQAHETLYGTGRFYRLIIYSRFRRLIWRFLKLTVRHPYIGHHSFEARERSLSNLIKRAEVFDDLEKIKVRTLLTVGSKDRKIYLDNLKKYKPIKNVEVVVRDFTHHAPAQNPKEVSEIIIDFVN